VEFGKGQAPEVVEQFIKREVWEWTVWGIVWVLAFLVWFQMKNWAANRWKEGKGDEPVIFALIVGWIGMVTSVGGFITCIQAIVSIRIAPKVLVLEKLGELLR
jgi:hypothetical protein